MAAGPQAISIDDVLAGLRFLADRSPTTTAEESAGVFAQLSPYRDGGIFVGSWSGTSEWERHDSGDEIVMVLDGSTTIFFLDDDCERAATLGPREMVVVPRGTWHRFETPDRVTVLSVTPQPTDHTPDRSHTRPPHRRLTCGGGRLSCDRVASGTPASATRVTASVSARAARSRSL